MLALFATLVAVAEKRFSAVWNCPYMGKEVVGKCGLSANPRRAFNGSFITLFHGLKTWPNLKATQNPSVNPCWSGKQPCTWNANEIWSNITVVSNGGVPEAGDIEMHKAGVAEMV